MEFERGWQGSPSLVLCRIVLYRIVLYRIVLHRVVVGEVGFRSSTMMTLSVDR